MDRSDERYHFVRIKREYASKAKKGKAPRSAYVYAALPKDAAPHSVKVDRETGSIEFVGAVPGSVSSSYEYDRESGKPKHQFWGGGDTTLGYLGERAFIEAHFDHLFAVDTNTKEFDGAVYAVSASCRLDGRVADYLRKTTVRFSRVGAFVFMNPKAPNPETIGWHYFLNHLLPTLGLKTDTRIGVIVDSELGDLQAMNRRLMPYHRRWALPADVQFVYASDRATDTLSGQMIRHCHRSAADVLNQIEHGQRPTDTNGCEDFEAYFSVQFT